MSIRNEFPDYDDKTGFYDLLSSLDGHGFHDSSWHNDACPSLYNKRTSTRIWVDYADPAKRDSPGKRFVVEHLDGEDTQTLMETDLGADVIELLTSRHLLTPDNCGCSPLACSIVNQTFLQLDGFAAMRNGMDGSYTAQQFAGELARIADRIIIQDGHVLFAAEVLRIMSDDEWNADTTQAIAEAADSSGLKIETSRKYTVTVKRTEQYIATTVVEAMSEEEARNMIEAELRHGWDAVFPGEDGSYEECYSEVDKVEKS